MKRILHATVAAFGLLAVAGAAQAAEVEVKMLNKGEAGMMVFEPAVVHIQPGDTVKFIATDKGHNAEALKGMVPEGVELFKGKMNEEIVVTFDQPGIYGYMCKPHYAMGMVGLIVVGDDTSNLEAAQAVKHPGKAKAVFSDMLAEAAAN